MREAEPTLLLTRPEAQSKAFLNICETRVGHRLPVVISPLLRIEPVGDIPDLGRYGTIVATSSNAVERLGEALSGRTVRTVGEKTAERARKFGAKAEALGENVELFLAAASDVTGPVLVARGVHARGNVAEVLRGFGLEAEEAVVYDQVAQPLTRAARLLLDGSTPVVAPLFSPRSAALLARQHISAPLTLVAISETTADEWTGKGVVQIAERPDAEAMCAMVVKAF